MRCVAELLASSRVRARCSVRSRAMQLGPRQRRARCGQLAGATTAAAQLVRHCVRLHILTGFPEFCVRRRSACCAWWWQPAVVGLLVCHVVFNSDVRASVRSVWLVRGDFASACRDLIGASSIHGLFDDVAHSCYPCGCSMANPTTA